MISRPAGFGGRPATRALRRTNLEDLAMTRTEGLDKAEQLYKAAFDKPRDPRSDAYKRGVLTALIFRLAGDRATDPYPAASAESDAFHAGSLEGHGIYRRHEAGEL